MSKKAFGSFGELAAAILTPEELIDSAWQNIQWACADKEVIVNGVIGRNYPLEDAVKILQRKFRSPEEFKAAVDNASLRLGKNIYPQKLLVFAEKWAEYASRQETIKTANERIVESAAQVRMRLQGTARIKRPLTKDEVEQARELKQLRKESRARNGNGDA